jgi:hypothetical protein
MKVLFILTVVMLTALAAVFPVMAASMGHSGGGHSGGGSFGHSGGGHSGGGHDFGHSGSHGFDHHDGHGFGHSHVFIGGGFGFPYYPYYYPYPYAYDYGYYPYDNGGAQTYVEPQPSYWYLCQSADAYYPYVSSCPEGWTRVVPTPQG